MAYLIGLSETIRKPSVWGLAQDGVPTDRQMLTYDSTGVRWEYQWPGMTNFSENRTFTILPAGSTVATINTALTDYDVVYLEPGYYPVAAGERVMITNKTLIGLGRSLFTDGSTGASFRATANIGNTWVQLDNGRIENVGFKSTVAQTSDIVSGNAGNVFNACEHVTVQMDVSSSGYAFSGAFYSLDWIRTISCNGILYSGNGNVYYFGYIGHFYIYGAPSIGIQISSGVSWVRVENGFIDGAGVTTNGFFHNSATSTYGISLRCVRVAGCVQRNVYFANAGGNEGVGHHMSNVWSTNAGWDNFFISSQYRMTIDSCYADSGNCGFNWVVLYECAFSNLVSTYNNKLPGLGSGNFTLNNITRCVFTNLTSVAASNTSGSGLYIASNTFTANTINGYQEWGSIYGFFANAPTAFNYNKFVNIQCNYNVTYGFYVSLTTQASHNTYSGIATYGVNNGRGISIVNSNASYGSTLTDLNAWGSPNNNGVTLTNFYNSTLANIVSFSAGAVGVDLTVYDCACSNIYSNTSTSNGIRLNGARSSVVGGAAVGSTATGIFLASGANWTLSTLIAYSNTGAASDGVYITTSSNIITGVMSYNNGRYGFQAVAGLLGVSFVNCVAASNVSRGWLTGNSAGGRWNAAKSCGSISNGAGESWGGNWNTTDFDTF